MVVLVIPENMSSARPGDESHESHESHGAISPPRCTENWESKMYKGFKGYYIYPLVI
jgi:hypothetical protein